MMFAKVALAVVLSQYVRSKVTDGDPNSPCLYWLERSTIVFHQHTAGNDETPGETEFTAISKAYATWQAEQAACGSLTVSEGARTATRVAGYDETSASNENVVLFRQRMCTQAGLVPSGDQCLSDDDCGNKYDCWQHAPGAIAITTTSFHPASGRILDSDIELNTPRFLFTTVDAPPCPLNMYDVTCVATDVQNTVTHEVGHLLGLGHTTENGSTMAPRADPGETSKRVLDANSKKFVCDVYPKDKPAKACIIKPYDGTLGEPVGGCATAPGALALGLAALLLTRRRR